MRLSSKFKGNTEIGTLLKFFSKHYLKWLPTATAMQRRPQCCYAKGKPELAVVLAIEEMVYPTSDPIQLINLHKMSKITTIPMHCWKVVTPTIHPQLQQQQWWWHQQRVCQNLVDNSNHNQRVRQRFNITDENFYKHGSTRKGHFLLKVPKTWSW